MNSLRLESEEATAKNEELSAKVKTLEQENLSKEQEITSLSHKNQLLETEVEKLEEGIKGLKKEVEDTAGAGTHNESLQRRLQLLEEEAEESDKTLRETNEKYEAPSMKPPCRRCHTRLIMMPIDYARPMSNPATTNAKCKPWKVSVIIGRRSTRRWPRNTRRPRRNWRTSISR